MVAKWAAEYVGLPYRDRGRDRTGLDCWGLVRLVLREQFSIQLPSLGESYRTCLDEDAVARLVKVQRPLVHAERVFLPQEGDIVLARLRGFACHVGVFVGSMSMLHVRSGTDTVVDRIDETRWTNRIEGFYRV